MHLSAKRVPVNRILVEHLLGVFDFMTSSYCGNWQDRANTPRI